MLIFTENIRKKDVSWKIYTQTEGEKYVRYKIEKWSRNILTGLMWLAMFLSDGV
jgi:hypothetical protein